MKAPKSRITEPDINPGNEEERNPLIDDLPIIVCRTDLKGKIKYINKRFEDISGYSQDEICGKNALKPGLFPADTLRYLKKRIAARLRGAPPEKWDTQVKRKDGSWAWVNLEGSLIRKSGIPIGFQIVASDITNRKLAEKAMEDKETLLDSLMDNIPDSIYFKDRQCRLVHINRMMLESLGYENIDRIVGKTDEELYGEEFGLKTMAQDRHIMATGEPIIGLIEERTLENGQTNWTSTTKIPLRDHDGQIVGLVGITREINELKQTEDALRESEERFRSIFENTTIGLYRTSPDGRILLANPALLNMLGYQTFEELAEHNLEKNGYEAGYNRDEFRNQIERDGVVRRFESAWNKKDGSTVFIRENARVIRDDKDQVLYYEGTVEDITEYRQIEAERERMIEKLQGALNQVKKLSGMIPICARCKKIRDDKGYWNDVAEYISDHSDAQFSHGLCPDCMRVLYPGYVKPPGPNPE